MLMNDLCLIDTNLLVYSETPESEFFTRAVKFMEKAILTHNTTISLQNLTEFYAIMTGAKTGHPEARDQVINKINWFVNSELFQIIRPTPQTAKTLIDQLRKFPVSGKDIHDVFLAATMIDNGINTIYTADTKIFKKLGLQAINPL